MILKFSDGQYHSQVYRFFENESIILKMNLCTSHWNKANIHIFYDCLNIIGFLASKFAGFVEATKQTAENKGEQCTRAVLQICLQLGDGAILNQLIFYFSWKS